MSKEMAKYSWEDLKCVCVCAHMYGGEGVVCGGVRELNRSPWCQGVHKNRQQVAKGWIR